MTVTSKSELHVFVSVYMYTCVGKLMLIFLFLITGDGRAWRVALWHSLQGHSR